jgi:hypothetical protein
MPSAFSSRSTSTFLTPPKAISAPSNDPDADTVDLDEAGQASEVLLATFKATLDGDINVHEEDEDLDDDEKQRLPSLEEIHQWILKEIAESLGLDLLQKIVFESRWRGGQVTERSVLRQWIVSFSYSLQYELSKHLPGMAC